MLKAYTRLCARRISLDGENAPCFLFSQSLISPLFIVPQFAAWDCKFLPWERRWRLAAWPAWICALGESSFCVRSSNCAGPESLARQFSVLWGEDTCDSHADFLGKPTAPRFPHLGLSPSLWIRRRVLVGPLGTSACMFSLLPGNKALRKPVRSSKLLEFNKVKQKFLPAPKFTPEQKKNQNVSKEQACWAASLISY